MLHNHLRAMPSALSIFFVVVIIVANFLLKLFFQTSCAWCRTGPDDCLSNELSVVMVMFSIRAFLLVHTCVNMSPSDQSYLFLFIFYFLNI